MLYKAKNKIKTRTAYINVANKTPLAEKRKFFLIKIKNKPRFGRTHKLIIFVKTFIPFVKKKNSEKLNPLYLLKKKNINAMIGVTIPSGNPTHILSNLDFIIPYF